MASTDDDEAAEKAKNRIIEIHSKLFDKASSYSNLILLGGYAGAFTIWNYTKPQLPLKANIVSAILLGISLAVFIWFEVFKMMVGVFHYRRVTATLTTATSAQDFLEKWRQIELTTAKKNLTSTRVWEICLVICAFSGVSGDSSILQLFLLSSQDCRFGLSDPWVISI